jgi:signal transduction histidine kinase
VKLSIVADRNEVRLQVADNGKCVVGTISAGSGITGMAERARLLGGTCTATALPQGGFVVEATLPIVEEA